MPCAPEVCTWVPEHGAQASFVTRVPRAPEARVQSTQEAAGKAVIFWKAPWYQHRAVTGGWPMRIHSHTTSVPVPHERSPP